MNKVNWQLQFLMGLACLTLAACSPLPTTPRARARATVTVLAGSLDAAQKSCNAVVERTSDLALGKKCLAAYTTAYDSLMAAGGAIDAWDEGKANSTTCATVRGAEAAGELAAAIERAGGSVPKALQDGLELYSKILGNSCRVDADAGGAS